MSCSRASTAACLLQHACCQLCHCGPGRMHLVCCYCCTVILAVCCSGAFSMPKISLAWRYRMYEVFQALHVMILGTVAWKSVYGERDLYLCADHQAHLTCHGADGQQTHTRTHLLYSCMSQNEWACRHASSAILVPVTSRQRRALNIVLSQNTGIWLLSFNG